MVNNRLYSTRNAPHVALMRQTDIMQAAPAALDSPGYMKKPDLFKYEINYSCTCFNAASSPSFAPRDKITVTEAPSQSPAHR
jgi:hypothetical protein